MGVTFCTIEAAEVQEVFPHEKPSPGVRSSDRNSHSVLQMAREGPTPSNRGIRASGFSESLPCFQVRIKYNDIHVSDYGVYWSNLW